MHLQVPFPSKACNISLLLVQLPLCQSDGTDPVEYHHIKPSLFSSDSSISTPPPNIILTNEKQECHSLEGDIFCCDFHPWPFLHITFHSCVASTTGAYYSSCHHHAEGGSRTSINISLLIHIESGLWQEGRCQK